MFKHLGIAGKLVAMLLVPLVGLAYFAGVAVLDKADTAAGAGRLQADSELAVRVSGFVHEVQKERGLTALFLGSAGAKYGTELREQRTATDRTLAAVRTLAVGSAAGPSGQLAKALEPLATLAEHRSGVDAQSIPPADATGYYTKVNAGLLDVVSAVAGGERRAGPERAVEAYANYLRAKEQTGLERAALARGFTAGAFQDGAETAKFLSAVAGQDAYLQAFARQATAADARAAAATVQGEDVERAAELRALAISRLRAPDLGGARPDAWFAAMTAKIDLMKRVEDRLAAGVSSRAGALESDARRALLLNLALALLAGAAAVALAVFLGRAIRRSVLAMLAAAEGIAVGDVEQEVETGGTDEIGRTTAAFARMVDYLRETAGGARRIAAGDLTAQVEPRSERDALGHAFVSMTQNLNDLVGQASQDRVGPERRLGADGGDLGRGRPRGRRDRRRRQRRRDRAPSARCRRSAA